MINLLSTVTLHITKVQIFGKNKAVPVKLQTQVEVKLYAFLT